MTRLPSGTDRDCCPTTARLTSRPISQTGSITKAWVKSEALPTIPRHRGRHVPAKAGIERWYHTLRNRILLENYFLPGHLEAGIERFVEHYNHHRYRESIGNLTPADVYTVRGQTILLERERIKRKTIEQRRLQHRQRAASTHTTNEPISPLNHAACRPKNPDDGQFTTYGAPFTMRFSMFSFSLKGIRK